MATKKNIKKTTTEVVQKAGEQIAKSAKNRIFRSIVITIIVLAILPLVIRGGILTVKAIGKYYISTIFPGYKNFENFKEKFKLDPNRRQERRERRKEQRKKENENGWNWNLGANTLDRWIRDNIPSGVSQDDIYDFADAFYDSADEVAFLPPDSVEEAVGIVKKYLMRVMKPEWNDFLDGLSEECKRVAISNSSELEELYNSIGDALYDVAEPPSLPVQADPVESSLSPSSPTPEPEVSSDSEPVPDQSEPEIKEEPEPDPEPEPKPPEPAPTQTRRTYNGYYYGFGPFWGW